MSNERPPAAAHAPDSGDAWSRLWRAGVLHSCSTAIDGNYDGEIAAFWNARFHAIDAWQRIVDIGTGNGALALLARQHAAGRGIGFDLHGVDAADIDPPRWASNAASFSGIAFHARTRMDNLPFDDGSVALVTSQYAFEYSRPRDATLHEVFRVIGPAGSAAFLLHSADSLISSTARQQLAACELLFDDTGILDLAHALISSLSTGGDAASVQHAFQQASERAVAAAVAMPESAILHKAFHYLHATLERAQTAPVQALQYLASARGDLEAERVRLQHLSDAIMPLPDLEDLHARSIAAGYASSTLAPLDQRAGSRMGWTLVVAP